MDDAGSEEDPVKRHKDRYDEELNKEGLNAIDPQYNKCFRELEWKAIENAKKRWSGLPGRFLLLA